MPDGGVGAETADERTVRQCRERAERRDAQQSQPLRRAVLDAQQIERQRRERGGGVAFPDGAVAPPGGGVRDEAVRPDPGAHGQIEARKRIPHGRKPAAAVAHDAVHLEVGAPEPGIFDQRRGGVERLEHLVPHPRVGDRIVKDRARVMSDRLGLDEGLTRAHAELARAQGAVDDAAAFGLVGQDQERVEVDRRLREARDGKTERGDPDADDRHKGPSLYRTYVRLSPPLYAHHLSVMLSLSKQGPESNAASGASLMGHVRSTARPRRAGDPDPGRDPNLRPDPRDLGLRSRRAENPDADADR